YPPRYSALSLSTFLSEQDRTCPDLVTLCVTQCVSFSRSPGATATSISSSSVTSSMNIEHTNVRTRSTGNCRMPTVGEGVLPWPSKRLAQCGRLRAGSGGLGAGHARATGRARSEPPPWHMRRSQHRPVETAIEVLFLLTQRMAHRLTVVRTVEPGRPRATDR